MVVSWKTGYSGNLNMIVNMIVRSRHVLRRVVYPTLLFRICDCYCRTGYSRAKHVSQNNNRYILLTYPIYVSLADSEVAFSFLVAFYTPLVVV